jgi:hypothetical protein
MVSYVGFTFHILRSSVGHQLLALPCGQLRPLPVALEHVVDLECPHRQDLPEEIEPLDLRLAVLLDEGIACQIALGEQNLLGVTVDEVS